jgi:heme/copper-type cytochrome/quinol oxidase subunit 1
MIAIGVFFFFTISGVTRMMGDRLNVMLMKGRLMFIVGFFSTLLGAKRMGWLSFFYCIRSKKDGRQA